MWPGLDVPYTRILRCTHHNLEGARRHIWDRPEMTVGREKGQYH
jgi:hypothetical protein